MADLVGRKRAEVVWAGIAISAVIVLIFLLLGIVYIWATYVSGVNDYSAKSIRVSGADIVIAATTMSVLVVFLLFVAGFSKYKGDGYTRNQVMAQAERLVSKSLSSVYIDVEGRIRDGFEDSKQDIISRICETMKGEEGNLDVKDRKTLVISMLRVHGDNVVRRCLECADGASQEVYSYRLYGMIITSFGLFVALVSLVFHELKLGIGGQIDTIEFLFRFVPITSFVLLCESVGILMFRYQSRSSELMRYYTNEANSISMKIYSFITSVYIGSAADISSAIAILAKSERNFLIGKGQKTIEMASAESERLAIDSMLDRLREALSPIRPEGLKGVSRQPQKKSRKKASQPEDGPSGVAVDKTNSA